MKNFSPIQLNQTICQAQLAEFQLLLQSKQFLSERDDILPFFRERQDLSALLGSVNPNIIRPDRIAFEYDIFGDFACDMVVGDSVAESYCFIEFEEASNNSIFVSKPGKSTPEWSPRFERGYSQIVDWFWKLHDLERTNDFENRFQSRDIDYVGLLIIGRSKNLELREKNRLAWRQKKTVVNSHHIKCLTFDELYQYLVRRLVRYDFILERDN